MKRSPRIPLIVVLVLLALVAVARLASAHCDTLDGPVVSAARLALERRDLQPVLKWIHPEAEPEVRLAFQKTLGVRASGGDARDLADRYFFETVVRLHRAGEGAPYTGLKPAGTVEKPVALADEALQQGNADAFSQLLAEHLKAGVKERFAKVMAAKGAADESPEAGRRYVAAYVAYVHYVEAIAGVVHGTAAHEHK